MEGAGEQDGQVGVAAPVVVVIPCAADGFAGRPGHWERSRRTVRPRLPHVAGRASPALLPLPVLGRPPTLTSILPVSAPSPSPALPGGAPTPWPGLTRHVGAGDDPVPLDLPVLLAEHALGDQHTHPRLGLQLGGCSQLRGMPGWERRGSEALRAAPRAGPCPGWAGRPGREPRRVVASGAGPRWGLGEGPGGAGRRCLPSGTVAHTRLTARLHRPFLPNTERLRR